MTRILSLDDPAALDPRTVGVKAARLARARRLGLPVLPGIVVPEVESRSAVAVGDAALRTRGLGAARSAAGTAGPDAGLVRELERVAELGQSLVVRSSTALDDDGAWAGAFASLSDVQPAEVATAVRGCWTSIFAPDAIGRLAATGRTPGDVGLAVLVQPQVRPRAGGWAHFADGTVEIAAVAGSPARLLGGLDRGARVVVAFDGVGGGDLAAGEFGELPIDPPTLRRLVALARQAHDELGTDGLEWAVDEDGGVVIFQLDRDDVVAAAPAALTTSWDRPAFERVARVLDGRTGRLADRLLVPWAAAAPGRWRPIPATGPAPRLLADGLAIADQLAAQVADAAGLPAADVVAQLEVGNPAVAARLEAISVDPHDAGRLLGVVDALAAALVERGRLGAPEALWWQSPEWLAVAVAGHEPWPAAAWLNDRWTDLRFGVAASRGARIRGLPAAPGRAVGRARPFPAAAGGRGFRARDILVVEQPLPIHSAMLWQTAALVCRNGSPAAHLCHVARSLRIPAVVSADIRPSAGEVIIAVDGTTGDCWLWSLDEPPERVLAAPTVTSGRPHAGKETR